MLYQLPDDAPSPRVCVIVKNNPEQEYGYNLHAEKGKPQFIGTVDSGSPADCGGLQPGDRIFAVNGHSIVGLNHRQVVQRIKENPLQCELLVISEEGAEWYEKHNIPITLSLPNIIWISQNKKVSDLVLLLLMEKSIIFEVILTSFCFGLADQIIQANIFQRKHDPTEEFGFNLHAEKNRGHFVGAVDKDGIGERAGLQMGQRIVGVNGQLIYPCTAHKAIDFFEQLFCSDQCTSIFCSLVFYQLLEMILQEVVSLIKKNPLRTELLVVSEDVDQWYNENHMEYSFDRVDFHNFESSSSPTNELTKIHEQQSAHSNTVEQQSLEALEDSYRDLLDTVSETDKNIEKTAGDGRYGLQGDCESSDDIQSESANNGNMLNKKNAYSNSAKVMASVAPLKQEANNFDTKMLEGNDVMDKSGVPDIFKLSAGEARSRLVNRKKDPRRDSQMSLKEKYQLVSNM
ncbi:unnamed protein product [Thelazia callipaeda]|uniref:PDZ domain-containing protein n=1 Tax=Thelazia callipaeda TaxID=103827 RepID=A0A158RB25_THECL|nr:unnamed protein product [Thelazia callipaeda]